MEREERNSKNFKTEKYKKRVKMKRKCNRNKEIQEENKRRK